MIRISFGIQKPNNGDYVASGVVTLPGDDLEDCKQAICDMMEVPRDDLDWDDRGHGHDIYEQAFLDNGNRVKLQLEAFNNVTGMIPLKELRYPNKEA